MLSKLSDKVQDEKGFTLIELLIVILIIALLAAIAIPTFLNQRGKASDASAKQLAQNAQTAANTIAVDNGTYTVLNPALVHTYEPTIPTAAGNNNAYLSSASGSASGYVLVTTSTNGDTFTITSTGGAITRTCTVGSGNGSTGGCPPGNSW